MSLSKKLASVAADVRLGWSLPDRDVRYFVDRHFPGFAHQGMSAITTSIGYSVTKWETWQGRTAGEVADAIERAANPRGYNPKVNPAAAKESKRQYEANKAKAAAK